MNKPDYRNLYHRICSCIQQWFDSDPSDFEFTPYLWVTELEGRMEVSICDTNEPEADMYAFTDLYEDFLNDDASFNHVILEKKVHEIVRKWCFAPTAAESGDFSYPEVLTEDSLMEVCERFRIQICRGDLYGAPEITVRYAVRDTMFHVAKFGEYFFFEGQMYVFDKNPIWKPYHDEFAVQAFFGSDCKSFGYAHVVAFCGIQTPYKDDRGDAIFTGDICLEGRSQKTYRVVTSNKWEGYGFAADNCMILLKDIPEPLPRVGTIFYKLSFDEVRSTWEAGHEICNMWGQADDIDEKLNMAKLTPSFMQEPLEYYVIGKIDDEYDWRVIFDSTYASPLVSGKKCR